MNSDRDYEKTVRSNEDLRESMEGIVNEPNKDRSMENQQDDAEDNTVD